MNYDTKCKRCKGAGQVKVVSFAGREPRGYATCPSCMGLGSVEALRDALLKERSAA